MWGRASSAPRGLDRLARRRQRGRRLKRVFFFILLLLLLVAAIYGLNQPAVRIAQIEVVSGDPAFALYATRAMEGSYFGLVPRDSTIFLPKSAIRRALLADHPEIAAVSLSHQGLETLRLRATERTAVALWCGLSPTPGVEEYCYFFDPNGYVFAAAEAASTTPTLNSFAVYVPLRGSTEEPLRATLESAQIFPAAFDFARRLGTMGAPVEKIVIRDGEVDDYVLSGTRVTYVLGREQDAMTALVSARSNLNLTDGSIEYIDLRFDGKVYVKRK